MRAAPVRPIDPVLGLAVGLAVVLLAAPLLASHDRSGGVAVPSPQPVVTPAPLVARLESAEFVLPIGQGEVIRARLRDGLFEDRAEELSVQMAPQMVAVGDLTGDGRDDAATVLWVNSGGSATFVWVVAVADRGGSLEQLGQQRLGDRVRVLRLRIDHHLVLLEMLDHAPDDPQCCPTHPATRAFDPLSVTSR